MSATKFKHSEPAVFVAVKDPMGHRSYKPFCDKCVNCREELSRALRAGGTLRPSLRPSLGDSLRIYLLTRAS